MKGDEANYNSNYNHQGPWEFPVSMLLFLSGSTAICWVTFVCCRVMLQAKLMRRYQNFGIQCQARILCYQPSQGIVAGRSILQYEYEYTLHRDSRDDEDDENDANVHYKQTRTDHRKLLVRTQQQQQHKNDDNNAGIRTIQKVFLGLREDDDELRVVDNDNGEQVRLVEMVYLPGYPQSAYPKARIDKFFRAQDHFDEYCCLRYHKAIFGMNLVLACVLLTFSIILQVRKKDGWNRDYDIAPLVWMILAAIALYGVMFVLGTMLSNRRILHGSCRQQQPPQKDKNEMSVRVTSSAILFDNTEESTQAESAIELIDNVS